MYGHAETCFPPNWGEANRAEEILLTPRDDGAAYAFHTHLVDSCSSKFRTEVFQVKYAMMDGQECHLLGLREFTDIKSLAGDNAADAILEGDSLHDDEWPPTLGELDMSGSADSRQSYQLGNTSSDASEVSNETLEQHNHGNGVVEKRLMHPWQHEVFPDLPAWCDCCNFRFIEFAQMLSHRLAPVFWNHPHHLALTFLHCQVRSKGCFLANWHGDRDGGPCLRTFRKPHRKADQWQFLGLWCKNLRS